MWSAKNGVVKRRTKIKKYILYILLAVALFAISFVLYNKFIKKTADEVVASKVSYDSSFTETEKQAVTEAIVGQELSIESDVTASVVTDTKTDGKNVLSAYVPVTSVKSSKQLVTEDELSKSRLTIWHEIDPLVKAAIIEKLGVSESAVTDLKSFDDIKIDEVAIVPEDIVDFNVKLLGLNDSYYLDDFNSGAIFRVAKFEGDSVDILSDLALNDLPNKEDVLSVHLTGVTALTRLMQKKLSVVNDPLYFSKYIGDFLSSADITHVSNEVSFQENCPYSNTLFCSDPRFIETLKASGVDIVELTGNHNNDKGSQNNTDTINLYHSLGWKTIGGGLNKEEAAKFYVADQKESKVAFLAYNYPDSPNGGAIAGATTAGANSFDFDKIKTDIAAAHEQSDFVIVNVQYWECYAYPEGYVEMPECDLPIGEQEKVFKQIVDLGADMIVGSSAHQPQIYELYKGKPIYYGLGNLYFDQTQWPGTERGIILTNYFVDGKLIQTKISPTIYDTSLQTKLMDNESATNFLRRLQTAR